MGPQARPPALAKAGAGHEHLDIESLLALTSPVAPVPWWATPGSGAVKSASPEQAYATLGLTPVPSPESLLWGPGPFPWAALTLR